jgi:hypothetical protein
MSNFRVVIRVIERVMLRKGAGTQFLGVVLPPRGNGDDPMLNPLLNLFLLDLSTKPAIIRAGVRPGGIPPPESRHESLRRSIT